LSDCIYVLAETTMTTMVTTMETTGTWANSCYNVGYLLRMSINSNVYCCSLCMYVYFIIANNG